VTHHRKNTLGKNSTQFLALAVAAVGVGALFPARPAQAATIYWSNNAGTNAWATKSNWWTTQTGTTNPASAPTNDLTTDIADFDQTSYATQPNFGTTSINGLVFGDGTTGTGAATLSGTALSLGASGIMVYANAGAVTINNGVKIGANQTWTNNSSNTLSIGATITNYTTTTPYTVTLAGSGNTSLGGIISDNSGSGTISLAKSGTGTLTLSGANTYTGTTTVTGGTLTLGAGVGNDGFTTSQTAGNFNLNGGTLQFNESDTLAFAHAITGTGAVVVTNSAAGLMLVGSNTFSGGLTLNSATGTMVVYASSANAFGSGTVTFLNAATNTLDVNSNSVTTGLLSSTQTAAKVQSSNGNGTLTLNGAGSATFAGVIANGNGTLALALIGGTQTLSGTNTYTGGTTINGGVLTLNTKTGSLAATGALTFTGSGTFNLDNTGATGALSRSFGTLAFNAGDATLTIPRTAAYDQAATFSAVAPRTVGATGNFLNAGGTNSATNGFIVTGGSGFIDQGTFYNGSNYAWMDATGHYVRGINYGSDTGSATSGAATSVASTSYQQITGAISAQANGTTFTTLNISGNNNFTLAGSATVTLNGILKSGNTAGGATLSGGTGIKPASGAELVIRTDGANDALTISTPILANGTNALTKSGAGTLTLSGANTYTGGTSISNGVLQIGNSSTTGALSTSSAIIDNASLVFNRSNAVAQGTDFSTAAISGTGGVTQAGTGNLTLNAQNTYSGGTTLSSGTLTLAASTTGSITSGPLGTGTLTLGGGTLGVNSGLTVANNLVAAANTTSSVVLAGNTAPTLSGTLTGTGTVNLLTTATAQIVPAMPNTTNFNGTVVVDTSPAGNIFFPLASTGPNAKWVVNGGGTGNGSGSGSFLDTAATALSLGELSGNGRVGSGYNITTVWSIGALGIDSTFSGVIINNYFAGTAAVTKVGTGALTLSGPSSYTGGTTISNGVLQIGNGSTTGALSTSSAITDNASLVFNRSNAVAQGTDFSTAAISGTGSITQAGAGNLTLNAQNTYSGGTTISSGTLTVAASTTGSITSGPLGTGTVTLGGGTLSLNGGLTIANNMASPSGATSNIVLAASGGSAAMTLSGSLTGTGTVNISSANTGATNFIPILSTLLAPFAGTVSIDTSTVQFFPDLGTLDGSAIKFIINGPNAGTSGNAAFVFSQQTNATIKFGELSGNGVIGSGNATGNVTTWQVGALNTNSTFSGVMRDNVLFGTGKAALTKTGSGTLMLSGTNTYTGATTVSGGTLTLANTGTLTSAVSVSGSTSVATINGTWTANTSAAGNVAVSNGGTINFAGTGTIGVASTAAILIGGTGGGTFNMTGGTLTTNYSNNDGWGIGNTGPGLLNVSGGSLTVANGNVFYVGFNSSGATGTVTLSGGTVTLGTAAAYPMFGYGGSTGTLNLNGGTLNTSRAISSAGGTSTFNFNGGTLQVGAANPSLLSGLTTANVRNGGAIIDDGGFAITVGQALVHSTIGGDAATDGGLTKLGSGTLSLTNANTFNGVSLVGNGTLLLSNASALGSSTFDTTGAGTLSFGSLTSATFGGLQGTGGLALANASAASVVLSVGANTSTFNGNLSGVGSLTKTGGGTLTLSGANTFTGGLTINGGSVILGSTGALNSAGGSENTVAFGASSTGTLALAGNSVVVASLNTNATPGTTYVENAIGSSVSNAVLTVGNATNATSTYAGNVQDGIGGGPLGLTKAGTGVLTLSGSNTYSGGTTLAAGTLVAGSANALGSGTVTLNAGTLSLGNLTLANNLSAPSGTTSSVLYNSSSGGIMSGALTGTGTVNFSFTAAGSTVTPTLPFFTTFQGTIGVDTSSAHIFPRIRQATGAPNATLNVTGGSNGGSTGSFLFVDAAGTVAIGALAGNGIVGGINTGTTTWQIGGLNGDNTFSGVIENNAFGGATALTKTGTGILTLSGANTYSGATTVNNGTLAVNGGSITGTGTIITQTGGTLSITNGSVSIGSGGGFGTGYGAIGTGTTTVGTGGTLTIGTGGGLTFVGGGTNGGNNYGTGILTINAGGSVNVAAAGGASPNDKVYINGYGGTGGTINISGGTLTSSRDITVGNNTGYLNFDGGTLCPGISGLTLVESNVTGAINDGGAIIDTNGLNATVAASLAHGGVAATDGGLIKNSAGTATFSGANGYNGGTTINAGMLLAANNTALGTGALTLNGGTLGNSNVTLANNIVAATASSSIVFTASGGLTGSLTGDATKTVTFSSSATSGTNTSALPTTLASFSGTLGIDTSNSFFYPAFNSTTAGGGVKWAINGGTSGGWLYTTLASGSTIALGELSGNGRLGSAYGGATTWQVGALNTNSTFSGAIIDNTFAAATTSPAGLAKVGNGILTLSGVNTYSGPTTVSAGTLVLTGANTMTGDTTPAGGALVVGHQLALQNSTLVMNSGDTGTVSFTVPAVTLGGLRGARNLDLGSAAVVIGNNNLSTSYTGNLTGGNGVTKVGTGVLTLTGTNTYQGATVINAGTLRLGGTLPSGLQVMPLGDSITEGQGANSGTLAGYREGLYNLLSPLAANMQYIGSATVIPGALPSSQQHHEGHGSNRIDNISKNLDGLDTTYSNNDGGYWFTGGNGTTRAAAYPDIILLQIGTNDILQNYQWSTVQSRLDGLVNKIVTERPNAKLIMADIVPITTSADSTVISYNTMVNAVAAKYAGLGDHVTVVDLHTNFPTGGMSTDNVHPDAIGYNWMASQWFNAILADYPVTGNSTALPANTPVTIGSGGTLDLAGSAAVIGPLAGAGNVTLGTGGLLNVNSITSSTFSGIISGAGSLIKSGGAILTLTGTNTYSGGTIVDAGVLKITNASAVGTGPLTLAGGSLDSGSISLTLAPTAQTWSNNPTFTGTGTLDMGTAPVTLAATQTLTVNNSTLTVGGVISDGSSGFGLTKAGSGTMILAAGNTFSGGTTITAGTLAVNSILTNSGTAQAQPLGEATSAIILGSSTSSGTLLYTGTGGTLDRPVAAQGNGSDTIQITGGGTLNLTAGLVKNGTVLTLKGGVFNIGGVGISGSSAGSDLVVDASTVNLNVASTYYGPTYIRNGGTLNANVAGALPSGAYARSNVILDDTGTGSTLALGASQSIAALTGATSSMVNLGSSTLTIGTASGSTTFAGVISDAGGGSLFKDNASTLTLSGANTYTGTTTVTGGKLVVSGSLAAGYNNADAVKVQAGNDAGFADAPTITRAVAASTGSYAGMGSAAIGSTFLTKANIVSGTNTQSAPAQLSMQWADGHTTADTNIVFSDVLKLSGLATSGGYTDTYVLEMTFDTGSHTTIPFLGVETSTGIWQRAVDLNSSDSHAALYAGTDWTGHVSLGNYGFIYDTGSTTHGMAWAVLDYNGTFAVIPEPTSLGLLGLGALGLLTRRGKRKA